MEDYLKKLDYILNYKHLENVIVTGNLTVFKIEALKTINSFDVENLLNKVIYILTYTQILVLYFYIEAIEAGKYV